MDRERRKSQESPSVGGYALKGRAPGKAPLTEATHAQPSVGGEGAAGQGATDKGAAADPKATGGFTIKVSRVAPGNASPSRTSVGVGETVTFTAKDEGDWTADGTVIGSGNTVEWTAPDKAGAVEIAHGKKGGKSQKQTMMVVKPSGVQFQSKGGFPVAPAGVGMTTTVVVLPATVSFGACEWLEQPGPADGVSGYFAAYVAAGKGDLAHKPNTNWLGMGDSNNSVEDHAWTSDNPPLKHTDGTTRHWAGAFGWNIPNKYRVKGQGDGAEFTNVRQQFNMAEDGTTTVQKGAATASQTAGGKVEGKMEKAETVGQAHAMLNRQGSRPKMIAFVMQYNGSADKDPDTLKNLVTALTQENIQVYVHVHCETTFNNFSRDGLVMTVKGPKGSHNESYLFNNKKNHEFTFALSEVLDFATMTPTALALTAINDGSDQAFSLPFPFPFETISENDASSSGHYKVSIHLQ